MKYTYPLCYPDGRQFGRVRTDCPPCRITDFRDKQEEMLEERPDYVISGFISLLRDAGYYAVFPQAEEESDLIFNL